MKILFIINVILIFCLNYIYCRGPISTALHLGSSPNAFNTTRDDCIWIRGNEKDVCPDQNIRLILYTNDPNKRKIMVDPLQYDWLRNSAWNSDLDNIIIIHGYAGGDNLLPITVLRDAYLNHGDYNVFMVDWGSLCPAPCYLAAIHNMKPVAKCIAHNLSTLRDAGLPILRTTCIGHSLGAHICGLMSNYINFRMERIIGLDPARPLIKSGQTHRLDIGDAKSVQIIHTNAGYYGENGQMGHVDFCVNGGKIQPYCGNTTNENLCSHIWSICYMAQSIYDTKNMYAEPCFRKCPVGRRGNRRHFFRQLDYEIVNAIPMGQFTPFNAHGSYCLKDNHPPFCPISSESIGDRRCCVNNPILV